ncbi:MAG TPA: hypothetical protein VIW92_16040 [Thermoanaerobaculia bacterium]
MPKGVILGRLNEQKGRSFEDRVAEAYRLLHYEVEHGRIFYNRQVDIFLVGRFGDFTVHRAIECKAGPVDDDQDPEMITIHRDLIHKIFSGVPPEILRIAWAFFHLGMSSAEIAEREGVSAATIYRRISEWRKMSRRIVGEGGF